MGDLGFTTGIATASIWLCLPLACKKPSSMEVRSMLLMGQQTPGLGLRVSSFEVVALRGSKDANIRIEYMLGWAGFPW